MIKNHSPNTKTSIMLGMLSEIGTLYILRQGTNNLTLINKNGGI